MIFKIAKKSPNIWTTFAREFVPKKFEKSPNLVTLTTAHATIPLLLGRYLDIPRDERHITDRHRFF